MTTPPEETAPAPDATDHERIGIIETKIDQLLSMFSKDDPPAQAEPEGERAEIIIAREIRDGIAKLAGSSKPEPAAAVKPAELAEKPPVPPVRRSTRIMGWND